MAKALDSRLENDSSRIAGDGYPGAAMETLLLVAFAVFLVNLPFGWWRAGLRKFSFLWMVAIHAPIPLVVALRLLSGLGFQWFSYPILVSAFFLGQWAGKRAGRHAGRQPPTFETMGKT